jgi:hypothetical protein
MATDHHEASAVRGRPSWGFEETYPLFTRAALVCAWLLGALATIQAVRQGAELLGSDAHAYWLAVQGPVNYGRPPGQEDAYLYSPAFAAAIHPLALLPFSAFLPLWVGLQAVALVWLLLPVRLRWAIPFFLLCVPELVNGNVYVLIAAAAVAGMRTPEFWAFPILSKVTTGVGVLWFAFRGEWRSLARASGATAIIAGVSYILAPDAWHAWATFLLSHTDGARDGRLGFVLRCLVAVALVAWGARRNRAWLIAPAMVLAAPVSAVTTFTLLVAIPRLALLGRGAEKRPPE